MMSAMMGGVVLLAEMPLESAISPVREDGFASESDSATCLDCYGGCCTWDLSFICAN